MTFQEFRAAVAEIAGERFHSAGVEVTTSSDRLSPRTVKVVWSAYLGGDVPASWEAATPEAVLIAIRGATEADIAAIGEVA